MLHEKLKIRFLLILFSFVLFHSCSDKNHYFGGEVNTSNTILEPLPPAPSKISLSDPDSSPGLITKPKIKLEGLEMGSVVKIYNGSNCLSEVTNFTAGNESQEVPLPELKPGDYTFYATTTFQDKVSECSTAFVFYRLSTKPSPPAISRINPIEALGTEKNLTFKIDGVTKDHDITLYSGPSCEQEIKVTKSEGPSVQIDTTVNELRTHSFSSKVTNSDGFSSDCSSVPATYTLSYYPEKPTLLLNKNIMAHDEEAELKIEGFKALETIKIYETQDCSGEVSNLTFTNGLTKLTNFAPKDSYVWSAMLINSDDLKSACSNPVSLKVVKRPDQPSRVELIETLSNVYWESSVKLRIHGVSSGEKVQIYTNNDCSTLLGEVEAISNTADYQVPNLIYGKHKFCARSVEKNGIASILSTNNAEYTYVARLTPPQKATLIDPKTSPSDDTTPTFKVGGITPNSSVKLFEDDKCEKLIGEISRDKVTTTTVDITTSVLQNKLYTIYGTQVDSNNLSSVCSQSLTTYKVSTTPQTPSGLSLHQPKFPIDSEKKPQIKVTGVESGHTVKLFNNKDCTEFIGSNVSQGTEVIITTNELTPGLPYEFFASSSNSDNLTSSCSTKSVPYFVLETNSALILSRENPTKEVDIVTTPTIGVSGVTLGMGVHLYKDKDCATPPLGQAEAFQNKVSITTNELSPGRYDFYANLQSKDSTQRSACSTSTVSYTVSTKPLAPTNINLISPTTSISVSNTPTLGVDGVTSGHSVSIYKYPGCKPEDFLITGLPTSITTPALQVGEYNFSARATKSDGISSDCGSKTLNYKVSSESPVPNKIELVMPTTSPGDVKTPTFRVSGVRSLDTVKIYKSSTCLDSDLLASGPASATTIDLTPTLPLGFGTHYIYARAFNPDQIPSNCSSLFATYKLAARPVISQINDVQMDEDNTRSVTFNISDEDTPTLNCRDIIRDSLNESLIVDSSLTISGVKDCSLNLSPDAEKSGDAIIKLTLSDGDYTVERSFTVKVIAVNDKPTLNSIGSQTTKEDTPISIPLTFNDKETTLSCASPSLTASSSKSGLVSKFAFEKIGDSCFIKITPVADQFGDTTMNVEVTDGVDKVSQLFTLTVTSEDDDPKISVISSSPLSLQEDGAAQNVQIQISDVDNPIDCDPNVTVSGQSGLVTTALVTSSNVNLTTKNCTYSVTPLLDKNGLDKQLTFTLTSNGKNPTATVNFSVIFTDDPPTITLSNPNISFSGNKYSNSAFVTIADKDDKIDCSNIIYSGSPLLTLNGITLSQTTSDGARCNVSLTPINNQDGTGSITLTLRSNNFNIPATLTFSIVKIDTAPVAQSFNHTITEEFSGEIPLKYSDGEGDLATGCMVTTSNGFQPDKTSCACPNGICTAKISLTPNYDQTTSFTYTVTANGKSSNSATTTIIVTPSDDPPTMIISHTSLSFNSTTAQTLSFVIDDIDSPYSCSMISVTGNTNLFNPITPTGSGQNCTASITPQSNQTGSGKLTFTLTTGSPPQPISREVSVSVTAPTPQIIVPGAGIHLIVGEFMKPLTIEYSPTLSIAPTCNIVNQSGGSISTSACNCTTTKGSCTFSIAGNQTSGPFKALETKDIEIRLLVNGATWATTKPRVNIYKKDLPPITKMYLASGITNLGNSKTDPVIYVENPILNDRSFEIKFYGGGSCNLGEITDFSLSNWITGYLIDRSEVYTNGYSITLPNATKDQIYSMAAKYRDTVFYRDPTAAVTEQPTAFVKESPCTSSAVQINYDYKYISPTQVAEPTGIENPPIPTVTNGITTHLKLKVSGNLKEGDWVNIYFSQDQFNTEGCGLYDSFLDRVQVPSNQSSIEVTVPLDARISGGSSYYYTANIYRNFTDSPCFYGGATYTR